MSYDSGSDAAAPRAAAKRYDARPAMAGAALHGLLETLPCGVSMYDANLEMIACNRLFRHLLELPDELFAEGLPSFERMIRFNATRGEYGPHPEAQVREILAYASQGQPHVYERARPNGIVLEIRGAPLPNGGLVAIFNDITRRRGVESEARRLATYLRAVLDSLPQAVAVFDESLKLVLCNGVFSQANDLPQDVVQPGTSFVDILHYHAEQGEYGEDDPDDYVGMRTNMVTRFEPHRFERTRPSGRILDIQGNPMFIDGAVAGFVTTYTDVTDSKRAERELRRVNTLFEEALAYSPTYVWEVDAGGCFTFLKGTEKVLGYGEAELLGRRFGELRCRDLSCREFRNALDDVFRSHRPYQHVLTCALHKDGTHLWLSVSGQPMYAPDGAFAGYRGVGFDVTETTNIRKELERMALMDALTGLANRRKFVDRFKLETGRQNRHGQPLSLLVLDIDHFKAINDEFGHLTGDLCLKCVADVLMLAVRKIDLVARFGGEEFIVLLPETDMAGATVVAEKLRHAIESLNIPIETRVEPVHITISVGVATMAADHQASVDDLMEAADQGLYKAKKTGRNRVCTFP